MNLHFGIALADVRFEPAARWLIAVSEKNSARVDAADELQQVIPIRMGSEVKIINFTTASDLATTGAEMNGFAHFRLFEPSARSVRIGITHKEDRMLFLADHAE